MPITGIAGRPVAGASLEVVGGSGASAGSPAMLSLAVGDVRY